MRRDIDNVEIKEPPLQEFKKKRSCLKRSCAGSCGCAVLAVIVLLILLKFVAVPRPKELSDVPPHFPPSVPVYDEEAIETITLVSGRQKNRALEIAAYVPKIVLVPLYLGFENYLPEETRSAFAKARDKHGWQKFISLLREPITDQRDTVTIEWENLSAEPSFVQEFYDTELKKSGFDVQISAITESTRQMIITKDSITGVLIVEDNANKSGTDTLTLTLSFPPSD